MAGRPLTGALSWRYCLGSCAAHDDPGLMSNVDVVFDPSGHIERVSADYLQYAADANFTVERATVTFPRFDCPDVPGLRVVTTGVGLARKSHRDVGSLGRMGQAGWVIV